MTRGLRHLPGKSLAAFGFLTNLVWEFVQCPLLYDMTGWSFWKGAAYMSAAVLGDVLIVVGVVAISWLLLGRSMTALLASRGWVATVTLGLTAGILLEWLARVLSLWGYRALMPTISIADEAVGLAPVIQIAILPAFSLYLAARFPGPNDTSSPTRA